ncbi:MAG: hypothetical protein RMK29_05060 [Myxococcales bacterium]|nr:hypothetical protein [Myxococcota bacterium]MDW8281060.1 hypothetical protein [Myxococcales bacterium]
MRTWELPPTVRAALSGAEASERGAALWQGMEPVALAGFEPTIEEQEEGAPTAARGDTRFPASGAGRPRLTVVEGGLGQVGPGPRAGSASPAGPIEQSVVVPPAPRPGWQRQVPEATLVTAPPTVSHPSVQGDPSARLMDAIRAHAAAQAASSDDRITLGDLTLIAIAAGQEQIAAAHSGNAPAAVQNDNAVEGQPLRGESKDDQVRMVFQLQHLVRQILDEIAFNERLADERYGEQ